MDHAAFVRRFFDLQTAGDLDGLRAILAEDFVIEVPFTPGAFPGRIEGREAFLELLGASVSESGLFARLEFHDITTTVAEGGATCFAEYRGDGSFAQTDLPYENRYIARFDIQDGRITLFREYLDPAPVNAGLAAAARKDQ